MLDLPPHQRRKLLPLAGWLTVAVVAAGCANLQAIRQFAQSSTDAETYKTIATDYTKISEREKYYSRTRVYEQYDQQEKRRRKQRKALLDIQKVIAEYMEVLGELAADEPVSYDKSIGSLVDSLQATKALDASEIQAFKAIGTLLGKAWMDAYRQKKLNEVITKANEPLQKLVLAETRFVECYINNLDAEKVSITRYYGKFIISAVQETLKSEGWGHNVIKTQMKAYDQHYGDMVIDELNKSIDPSRQGILILVREHMHDKLAAISRKQENARNYLKVLKEIGEAHQKLYDGRNKLTSPELLAEIKGYAKYINDAMNAAKNLK